jgi:phosphoserine aminotransferase
MQQLVAIFGVFCLLAFSGLFDSDRQRRVFNFSAGPAALSLPVLLKAQSEFLNHNGAGAAIFEQSHRDAGGAVQVMIASATQRVRSLLSIPATYEVLYLHGGAHGQFAALPLNLCEPGQMADYVNTGFWSKRAHDEAARQGPATLVNGVASDGVSLVPPSSWAISNNSCFVHFCASETIDSFEFFSEPDISKPSVPLVGDFTSTILSRRIDISKYGVIYAAGGKNLGPSKTCHFSFHFF